MRNKEYRRFVGLRSNSIESFSSFALHPTVVVVVVSSKGMRVERDLAIVGETFQI